MPCRFPQDDMENCHEFVENNKFLAACLDKMYTAVAIIHMEVDETNTPVDFTFVYANEALAKLENVHRDKLIGASFYKDLFPSGDKKWLLPYWDTACNGMAQTLKDYSPEIGRFIEISCYQVAYGYCACIVTDVSGKINIQKELEDARHCMEIVFQNTLDNMFFYDIEDRVLINDNDILPRISNLPLRVDNVPRRLVEYGIIQEKSLPDMERFFESLHENTIDCGTAEEFELNLTGEEGDFQWYKLTFTTYFSEAFNKKYILIFIRNINQEVAHRHKLENEASKDGLTGLYNRKTAVSLINDICAEANTKALFLFDLDDFKGINDTYGHAAGDTTLQVFGRVLKNVFRKNDIVFRLGGDEFGAFVHGNGTDFIKNICERIFEALGAQKDLPFQIRASIGIGLTQTAKHTYMDYYQIADKALYAAKNSGKNIWHLDIFS